MDDIDRATANQEEALKRQIAAARGSRAIQVDSHECVHCTSIIPIERREALGGTEYCAACAEDIEAGQRNFARR